MRRGLLLAALLSAGVARAQTSDSDLVTFLRSKDQVLLDAITLGDRGAWDRALTPDAVYLDENGAVMDRAAYLDTVTPLPPGISGKLKIVDYRLRRHGDVALVIHRDDEREDFHGVALHANYLMSETWIRSSGNWRLAMVHAYVVAVDPPATDLPVSALDTYVGTYRTGTDLTYVIQRHGDHLAAGRLGAPMKPLLAEARDVLFTPGEPRIRRFFSRDASGRVTGFTDRREGEDIVWTKVAG